MVPLQYFLDIRRENINVHFFDIFSQSFIVNEGLILLIVEGCAYTVLDSVYICNRLLRMVVETPADVQNKLVIPQWGTSEKEFGKCLQDRDYYGYNHSSQDSIVIGLVDYRIIYGDEYDED